MAEEDHSEPRNHCFDLLEGRLVVRSWGAMDLGLRNLARMELAELVVAARSSADPGDFGLLAAVVVRRVSSGH